MKFGRLIVAFQNAQVCMVEQQGFYEEASRALDRKFPFALYKRVRLEESPIGINLSQRVDELVGILESPINTV